MKKTKIILTLLKVEDNANNSQSRRSEVATLIDLTTDSIYASLFNSMPDEILSDFEDVEYVSQADENF